MKTNIKCEICNNVGIVEKHHIHSRSHGGSNKEFNLSMICPNCHAAVHYGEIILEGKFQSSAGMTLIHRLKNEASITGNIDPPVWRHGKKSG